MNYKQLFEQSEALENMWEELEQLAHQRKLECRQEADKWHQKYLNTIDQRVLDQSIDNEIARNRHGV